MIETTAMHAANVARRSRTIESARRRLRRRIVPAAAALGVLVASVSWTGASSITDDAPAVADDPVANGAGPAGEPARGARSGPALPAPRPAVGGAVPVGTAAVRRPEPALPAVRPQAASPAGPIGAVADPRFGPARPEPRPRRADAAPIEPVATPRAGPARPDVRPLRPVAPLLPPTDGPAVPDDRPERPAEGAAAPSPVPPAAVAKRVFGAETTPAPGAPRAVGGYSRGCLAGAAELPADGPTWQAMRPARDRAWGHPALIAYLERLAADAPSLGWRGLLVGDLAQPRGGPMPSGHVSHQIGLDADIWLTPMPTRRLTPQERDTMSAVSVLTPDFARVDPAVWTDAHARLLERAASDAAVARIFVHPAIKRALCRAATPADASRPDPADAAWLRRIRPWYGHHYHFHGRLACPEGGRGCRDQDPPPPGAGCGAALNWWFTEEPYRPKPGAGEREALTIADLPRDCRAILAAR